MSKLESIPFYSCYSQVINKTQSKPTSRPLYHIENITAYIKEELSKKNISKKYLARQLRTSDNQIQRLLNPNILNKNLTQLYKLASLLELEFQIHLKSA